MSDVFKDASDFLEKEMLRDLITKLLEENEKLEKEVEELRDRLKLKGEESQAV